MKLNRLEINQDKAIFCDIPDEIFKLLQKVYHFRKPKPNNSIKFFQLYIALIKSIGGKTIIISRRIGKGNTTIYKLNDELITEHIKIDILKTLF